MRQRIYLCEGETERRLIRALKDGRQIRPGKIEVFNAVQNDVKSMLRKWGRGPLEVVVIVDADTGPYDGGSRLARNLKTLNGKYTPWLILQCDNLEDELARGCDITVVRLCGAFDASSRSEFKDKFLDVRQDGLLAKLESLGFRTDRLWTMACKDCKLDKSLEDYCCIVAEKVLLGPR